MSIINDLKTTWELARSKDLPILLGFKTAYNKVPTGMIGRPQRPPEDIPALMQAYRTSEIVYACIAVKAQAVVDPRLLVERRTGSQAPWQEVEGHPMRRLMMRPNPLMDEAGFARAAITSCDIAGVFYVEIVRKTPNGLPVALYPLDPGKVLPIPDAEGGIASYLWKDGIQTATIPVEDMLVWRNYNPQNRYNGLSPLSVALGSIIGDNLQTDYIRSFFDTGGVPSGILTIGDRDVLPEEADIIRQRWRAKFNPRFGGVKDDIAVLDRNASFQVLGSRLNELESEEIRSVAETRICMVLSVPPLIIYAYAGLKSSTYSNLKEAWAQFWASYLTPWAKQYRSWLTWNLLLQFESEDALYSERIRLTHDMSEVVALQDDVDATHTRARASLNAGGITLNEFREIVGQAEDTEGDIYLRTMGVQSVQIGGAADAVVEPDEIQQQALNGAQIDSLVMIIQGVTDGTLAAEAAIEILVASFPFLDRAVIEKMVRSAIRQQGETPAVASPDGAGGAVSGDAAEDAPMEAASAALPSGLKRMMPSREWLNKALLDRDRIAERNVNKIERYLMAQYMKAAEVVRGGKADVPDVETKALGDRVADALDDGEEVAATVRPMVVAATKKGFGDGATTIALDMAFDLENERVQDVLGELLKLIKRDIPQTTIEQVRELVGKQAAEGWSVDRLADEILALGEIHSPVRAQMIAHTETARAYTKGSILSYQDSGVVEMVEWSSFLDDRTTEICIGLNGKRVKLGEMFDGGFDGPPAHIRCRSAIIPIVSK